MVSISRKIVAYERIDHAGDEFLRLNKEIQRKKIADLELCKQCVHQLRIIMKEKKAIGEEFIDEKQMIAELSYLIKGASKK